MEKQINFADVELGKEIHEEGGLERWFNSINDEENTKHSAKVGPDSKIANMVLFFLAIFLVGMICGFFAFIGYFFKVRM